jgi:hypothetical protein
MATKDNLPEDLPAVERPEPFIGSSTEAFVSDDNEIDFDDERGERDQLPLDRVEAREAGVLLDDPEKLDPEATD